MSEIVETIVDIGEGQTANVIEVVKPPKKKRVMKVKEIPLFLQIETLGKVKTQRMTLEMSPYGGSRIELYFSPYVSFIPIQYLAITDRDKTDEEYVNRDVEERMSVNYHSRMDEHLGFATLNQYLSSTGSSPAKLKGFATLVFENRAHVIATILPENLVYQKLHFLKHGTIDLSKVIILIDSALDSTSFPSPRVREMYRKELLPMILETSCTVFKVPIEFIMSSCFYNKEEFLPTNIHERRVAKVEIVEMFRKSGNKPGNVEGLAQGASIYLSEATMAGTSRTISSRDGTDIVAGSSNAPTTTGVSQVAYNSVLTGSDE